MHDSQDTSAPIRVLHIDDDPEDAEIVRTLIRKRCPTWSISWFDEPSSAFVALASQAFDVALVDFYLGSCTGLEVLEALRAEYPTLPVLLLTGDEHQTADLAAVQGGAFGFLGKNRLTAIELERGIRYAVEHSKGQEKLAREARTDALTGLLNRAGFSELAERALARIRIQPPRNDDLQLVGCLLIDLDGFKAVNDTHGHAAGDRLLCAVARCLEATIRPTDIVGRLGGDEFVILLQNLKSRQEAEGVAQRLVEQIAAVATSALESKLVTASIGGALSLGTSSYEAILSKADGAMYRAKQSGKNQALIASPQSQRALPKTVEALQEAIGAASLQAWARPWLNTEVHQVTGFQIIPRLVPIASDKRPLNSIELRRELKRSNLIQDLDRFLLESYLATDIPNHVMAYLCVSGASLRSRAFRDRLKDVSVPNQLYLGLEEAELASCEIDEALCHLAGLGMKLGVHNFGEGPLGLARFIQLPIDLIRVGRAMFGKQEPRSINTLRALVAGSSDSGSTLIATEVDTRETSRWLGALGLVIQEGKAYAEPMPLAGFETWLASSSVKSSA